MEDLLALLGPRETLNPKPQTPTPQQEMELLLALLEPGDTVLEAGTHIGSMTVSFSLGLRV